MRSSAVIFIFALLQIGATLASPPRTIREALLGVAAGKLDPAPLSVTYDDMHALWGGLALTIHGTGKVEQRAAREKVGTPRVVSRKDLLKLVRLLLREEVWAQGNPSVRSGLTRVGPG